MIYKMALTNLLLRIVIITIFFIITSLPLYLSVKLLKGKITLLKAVLINLISGVIVAAIEYTFPIWGGLIAFLVIVVIYREAFRLKWWKAFVVWILQLILIVLFYLILVFLNIINLQISFLY